MDWKRLPPLVAVPGFVVALLSGSAVFAAPLNTWEGAKAEVYASGDQESNQGPVAEAEASGETQILYTSPNVNYQPDAYSVKAKSSAKAEALGTPDALLRVNIEHHVDNPGTRPTMSHSDVSPSASAEASWTGDRIHIERNDKGTLPDSVRLGVTLKLDNVWGSNSLYDSIRGGSVDLKLGDRSIHLNDSNFLSRPEPQNPDVSSWLLKQGFDSATKVPNTNTIQAQTFVDLPIDDQGWSKAIDLSLKSTALMSLMSNQPIDVKHTDFTLALNNLSLSDGTPISDAGYSATFDSGFSFSRLGTPNTVPEPTSLAAWFAVVGSAGWLSRKRARLARMTAG
jgi:hypothetical protein